MRRLRAATLVTPDPDATAALYATWFGYRHLESGAIPAALAARWGASAMEGRRYIVIGPESGVPIYLRFVQGATLPRSQALRTYGWAAIELCVQDVRAIFARMRNSPFTIIGPPKALDGAPAIWPMQVQGPDGEIIFLTEIRADDARARLPRAQCAVDCLFIAVHACADLTATRVWFETELSLCGAPNFELAYTTLSRAFGLPLDHKHRIAVLTDAGDAFLQLDQYPTAGDPRIVPPGALPPGIAVISLMASSLPEGTREAGVIYDGARSSILRTPDGALVELIEEPI
jgi:catechol 2,3-dioxygenase-like lactoylglutathione lyase family enzyme